MLRKEGSENFKSISNAYEDLDFNFYAFLFEWLIYGTA